MKNKKLLTRLFALLASLVLVFAFALPCFADVLVGTESYVIDTIAFTDRVSLYNWLTENYTRVLYSSFDSTLYDYTVRFDSIIALVNGSFRFQYIEVAATVGSGNVYNADPFYTVINVNDIGVDALQDASLSDGSGTYSLIPDGMWTEISAVFTITYLSPIENSGGSTDPTSPSSDMYSNLFNILKDAVYGFDAELTGSQEYALTLISTILTYATILLPVILVIFIAVWCFKRF